jgi:hypothetical protein
MPQTEVESTMPIGIAGQLADLWTDENGDVVSATSEEASAEIPFGVCVQHGTADDGVLKLTAIDDVLAGVVVHSHHFAKPYELGDTGLKPGVTFGLLRKGRIIVLPEDAVTPASTVHVRAVATGNEVAGAFRGTAQGTDTIEITAFAKWRTTADAGEPAVLEVDFTNVALADADS